MLSYFDSSLLLAILFDESRFDEAFDIWKASEARVSSVLLKIETFISLQRHYKQNEKRLGETWLHKKEKTLYSLLGDVFYKDITVPFADKIMLNRSLAACKSLDAIHVATALSFNENSRREPIRICSFDNNMLKIAKELGFETN